MKLPDARHIVVVAIAETAVRVDTEPLALRAWDALLVENLTGRLSIGAPAFLIAFV